MQVKNIDYARDTRLVKVERLEYTKDILVLVVIFTLPYFIFSINWSRF